MARRMNEVQTELLKILIDFQKICDEYDLMYFVSGGTLLGAVRHKGFIPWDDDIDLVMPRPDYERLLREVVLPEKYVIKIDDNRLYISLQNKMIRVKHGLESWDQEDPYLCIEICPLDGAGNSIVMSLLFTTYILILFVLIKLKRIEYIRETETLKNRKNRPYIEKLLIRYGVFFHRLLWFLDEKKLIESYYENCKKISYTMSRYACVFCGRHRYKEIFHKDMYKDGIELAFEGVSVRGYSDSHKYLSRIYGKDYMTLPPEGERERHGQIQLLL